MKFGWIFIGLILIEILFSCQEISSTYTCRKWKIGIRHCHFH